MWVSEASNASVANPEEAGGGRPTSSGCVVRRQYKMSSHRRRAGRPEGEARAWNNILSHIIIVFLMLFNLSKYFSLLHVFSDQASQSLCISSLARIYRPYPLPS